MIHTVNSTDLTILHRESQYDFRTEIPKGEYPQVHDFYEFSFVTSGSFYMEIDNERYLVEEGDLIMIFPEIVHGKYKKAKQESSHINLVFLSSTINELFSFLYGESPDQMIPDISQIIVRLTKNEKRRLQAAMEYLAFFPVKDQKARIIYGRKLLCDIIYHHIMPCYLAIEQNTIIPQWMQNLLKEMQNPDNLFDGLKFILEYTGMTESYLCRCFKKYLHTTPTRYINSNRLTYVANMLHHSDLDILTLSNNAGFISTSYFYSLFKSEFGVTPLQYRKIYQEGRKIL